MNLLILAKLEFDVTLIGDYKTVYKKNEQYYNTLKK